MAKTRIMDMPRPSEVDLAVRELFDRRLASAKSPLCMAERHCTDLETDSVCYLHS